MSLLLNYTAQNDAGPCRDAFSQFENKKWGLRPNAALKAPVQIDWRPCIEEAKKHFQRFEAEILKQIRFEMRDPEWNFSWKPE